VFFRKGPILLTETLEGRFTLDHVVGETVDGIGYQGFDKQVKKTRVIWTTRSALSERQKKGFFKHVRGLIATRVEPVLDFGVDAAGIGFVVISASVTKRLDYDLSDGPSKARRFIRVLLALEAIHISGSHCGNLTPDSFMLDSNQQVHFVGFIGGLRGTTTSPVGVDYQRYQSPEVISGELPSRSCDVYALGVIGLELFGVGFPEGPLVRDRIGEYLKAIQKDTPVWLQAALPNVVTSDPAQRFKTASQLLSAISIQLRNHEELMQDDGGSEEDKSRVHEEVLFVSSLPRSSRTLQQILLSLLRIPGVNITLALGILCGGVAYGYRNGFFEQGPADASAPIRPAVSHSKDLKTRLAGIRELDTPEVFKMLEAEEGAATAPGEKVLIWKSMVDYGRQAGMPRTAAALQRLLDAPSPRTGPLMASIMRLLNPVRSRDSDSATVTAIEQVDPETAYNIAAALTLDMSAPSQFREALLKGACASFQRTSYARCRDISTNGLILVISSTRSQYFTDILQSEMAVSEFDFWPILELMVAQRAEEERAFARFGIDRRLVVWPQSIFLEVLSSSSVNISVPSSELVAAAQGLLSNKAVAQFSDWYEPASVQALLGALLVSNSENGVKELALDALSNKPISDRALHALLAFIRDQSATPNPRYAPLVAAIGLRGQAPEEALMAGLRSLAEAPDRSAICVVLLQNGDVRLIRAVLDLYGTSLNPDLLLVLLEHPDKDVRVAVLPYLKGVVLTSAKQTLQNYYLHEQEPVVRAAYEREVSELLR